MREWLENSEEVELLAPTLFRYGHISNWDVSLVTNMSELFKYAHCFDEPLERWDVSNVAKQFLVVCQLSVKVLFLLFKLLWLWIR